MRFYTVRKIESEDNLRHRDALAVGGLGSLVALTREKRGHAALPAFDNLPVQVIE
jgi:hypothetical protein